MHWETRELELDDRGFATVACEGRHDWQTRIASIGNELDVPAELARILVLSTRHWPHDNPPFGEHRFAAHQYGAMVWLSAETSPDWLLPIVALARSRGATRVDFDRDVPPVDGLPVFNW